MTDLDDIRNIDFQQILTNPILDIGARIWDDDRYAAFKICYLAMRVMDDLVDDLKVGGRTLSETEKKITSTKISNWTAALAVGSRLIRSNKTCWKP